MAKEEIEEKGDEGRVGDFSSKRNVEGGRRRDGGACRGTRDVWRERRGMQSSHRRRKIKREREREALVALRPFAHRHRGLTRVSSALLFPAFLLPLDDGEREARKRRRARGR